MLPYLWNIKVKKEIFMASKFFMKNLRYSWNLLDSIPLWCSIARDNSCVPGSCQRNMLANQYHPHLKRLVSLYFIRFVSQDKIIVGIKYEKYCYQGEEWLSKEHMSAPKPAKPAQPSWDWSLPHWSIHRLKAHVIFTKIWDFLVKGPEYWSRFS